MRRVFVGLVVSWLAATACSIGGSRSAGPADTSHLPVASDFRTYHAPSPVGLMSSMADVGGGRWLVADPNNVSSVVRDSAGYTVARLARPAVPAWNPVGLAYRNGTVYVANGSGKDVLLLRLRGTALTLDRRITDPALRRPQSVVAESDGAVVVADQGAGAVLRFRSDGTLQWRTDLAGAYGLTEAGGNVYASSTTTPGVTELDANGRKVRSIGQRGVSRGRFLLPVGLAADGGRVIVTDTYTGRITTLDGGLRVVSTVGGNGPGLDVFNFPSLALPIDGGYVIVDTFKQRLVLTDRGWTVHGQLALGASVPVGRQRPIVSGSDARPLTYDALPGVDLAAALGLQTPEKFVGALNGLEHIAVDGSVVTMDFTDLQFGATSMTWAQLVGHAIVIGSSQRGQLEVVDPASGMFTFVSVGPDSWWHSGTLLLSSNLRRSLADVIAPALAAFDRARQLLAEGRPRQDVFNQVLARGKPRDWSADLATPAGQTFLHSAMKPDDATRYFAATLNQKRQHAVELLEVRYLSGS